MDRVELEGQLDYARHLYERVRLEGFDSPAQCTMHQAELHEELIRVTAATGHQVSLCSCGDVYYQSFGCSCGTDWLRGQEEAFEYTMDVLDVPYKPEQQMQDRSWTQVTGKVIDIQEWLARH